ncbi:MAG: DNA-protecting protein DprA [Pseudomonadota bacterium]|jgi:DNA processing protein
MLALDACELHDWLRLLLTPGLGLSQARRLLAALGSPQAIWAASPRVWADVLGQRDLSAWAQPPEGLAALSQQTLDWAELDGRHVLTLADPRYPRALLDAADPPLLLHAEGDLSAFDAPAVAIVGSRHATPQGLDHAQGFAQALAQAGVVVISGLARGIDAAAHEGALAGVAGSSRPATIAVVGTGLDSVYPKGHAALARRIAQRGLLLSEFTLGTPPLPGNFPRRNRIVAALSRGVLVVEAAVQSGSLITARLGAELGREVMAIPGSIQSPQARGCHALLKQGAKLVETAQDVLEELTPWLQAAPGDKVGDKGDDASLACANDAAQEADPVLRAMGHDPVSQEALSARTGWGPAELGAHLLTLELDGLVARLPGALYQRRRRA